MTDEILHQNENYDIVVNDDFNGYTMINRKTGVAEEEFTQLPTAISVAEQCNSYLVYQTWQWIRKQEESTNVRAGDTLEDGMTTADVSTH